MYKVFDFKPAVHTQSMVVHTVISALHTPDTVVHTVIPALNEMVTVVHTAISALHTLGMVLHTVIPALGRESRGSENRPHDTVFNNTEAPVNCLDILLMVFHKSVDFILNTNGWVPTTLW